MLGALGVVGLSPAAAHAGPGQAIRLSGVQPQGPASASVTAIHHNPAMLGAMRGFAFELNLRGGIDHRVAQREGVGPDGAPNGQLGSRANLVDPVAGGFLGGSFMLDPVAIGLGVYDLSNRYRYDADPAFRYQHVQDDDLRGGSLDLHHDFSVAIAWNFARRFRLGGAVHFPVLHQSLSRDDDTFLTAAVGATDGVGCGSLGTADAEDPRCAERIAIRTTSSRFNLTGTIGFAVALTRDWTLGFRYRTRPWLTQRRVEMEGKATVCIPDDAADAELYTSTLVRCSEAGEGPAAASVVLPREAAIGFAGRMGPERRWGLDANLYWIDRCDGLGSSCNGRDARNLSLVGLPQQAAILPETTVYRGYADVFGLELWGQYRLGGEASPTKREPSARNAEGAANSPPAPGDSPPPRARTALLFGAGFASPAVRRGATTIVEAERWRVSANLGARVRIGKQRRRQRGAWFVAPGYGLDVGIPSRVGASGATPDYDPSAALEFAASGRDINGPGADAVLAGRARPSNAGRYQQSVHTLTLSVGWSELGFEYGR